MKWAKLGELRAGDVVKITGFDCQPAKEVMLHYASDGLWFMCSSGRHYIEGQLNDNDEYVGIYIPQS